MEGELSIRRESMASRVPVVRTTSGDAQGVVVTTERRPALGGGGSACASFVVGARLWIATVSDDGADDAVATSICAALQRAAEDGATPRQALTHACAELCATPAPPEAADVFVAALDTQSGRCVQLRDGCGTAPEAAESEVDLGPSGSLTLALGAAGTLGSLTIAYAVPTPNHPTHAIDLSVVSELDAIDAVNARFSAFAASHHVPDAVRRTFLIAFDDLLNNIVSYAYGGDAGHVIDVHIVYAQGYVEAVVCDDGPAFDPFAHEAPDTDLDLDDREIGGLGVHLIRMLMDECRYERRAERNVATLRKYLAADAAAPAGEPEPTI